MRLFTFTALAVVYVAVFCSLAVITEVAANSAAETQDTEIALQELAFGVRPQSMLSADEKQQAANSFSLPPGLCTRIGSDYHTRFIDVKNNETYFFSMTLCGGAPSSGLTTAVGDKKCGPADARFRLVRVEGTATETTKDDECGVAADTMYEGLKVLNETQVTTTSSGNSDKDKKDTPTTFVEFEVGLYRSNKNMSTATTENTQLKLVIVCNSSAIVNSEQQALVILGVPVFTAGAAGPVLVEAAADCTDVPEKKTNRTGFYIAITFVLGFVIIFATVLFKAKQAGDRLRELKRWRGERVFLG